MTTTISPPTTPDLSFLAGLDPAVGIAAVIAIVIVQVLYFVGPGLRDRLRKPPTPSPPGHTEPAIPVVAPALPQAIDQADRLSAEFIAYLKVTVEARDRRIDELERTVARLEQEIDRLRWQRGGETR